MASIEDDWIEVSYKDLDNPPFTMSSKLLDPGLPLPNPTISSWQLPPDPLQNYRSSENLPTDVLDVVIIGSGLSGASVAWHLLHGDGETRDKYLKTLMLEAREVCSGATGRNGGHLSCGFYSYYSMVSKQYDDAEAALHSHFEKLNFEAVKEVIEREKIECEFKRGEGGWDVFLTDEGFEAAKRELEGMKAAGGYVETLKIFEGKEAIKASGVKYCNGAIFTKERASLRPYSLVTSLLGILVKQHLLQLHTNTAVTSIDSPSGNVKYYTLHTPRGKVKTKHVVNATNAWIGHLYPEFQGKIVPTRGQVIHVDAPHLKLDPMGWDDAAEYIIQRPDSSLILGGGRRFASKHREIGNPDDTSIDHTVSRFLHTFLPSQFSFVKMAGTEPPVESIREWTGIMGFSNDTHPYVGNRPEEPNKWVIGGFHGHGMVRIFLCAKALAKQLLAVDSGYATPWPKWMPRGYIYHPSRIPIDEIKDYLNM